MLSDEKIEELRSTLHIAISASDFRAIEAAVLAELAKREPVAYLHPTLPKAISVSDLEDQPEWVQRDWLKGAPLHPAPALNCTSTVTGRLSSNRPNMQNIYQPLRSSDCERLIRAAKAKGE